MSEPTPIRDTEENVKLIYQMSAKANFKEAVGQFYDKWAEHYDEDLENSKYVAPVGGAEELSKRVEDKNALIIDCAAGTGQVGVELAKRGFKNIDAVDMSQKSLDISASKGVYRKLFCDSLGKNKIKGVEDGCYDALTCIGAVGVGHIAEDAFVEWNRMLMI
ncbi:methyltransferase-like protein 27 [Asterias rubens]|uniref:methyltransferase-like protein 27 n=1 Tax=Asterias rubens TaxID=7604 RepID=UPI0014557617|nr:methyltransferase-like protein 27 [Asterias rubens]